MLLNFTSKYIIDLGLGISLTLCQHILSLMVLNESYNYPPARLPRTAFLSLCPTSYLPTSTLIPPFKLLIGGSEICAAQQASWTSEILIKHKSFLKPHKTTPNLPRTSKNFQSPFKKHQNNRKTSTQPEALSALASPSLEPYPPWPVPFWNPDA